VSSSQVTPSSSAHGLDTWQGRQGRGVEDSFQSHAYTSSQYSSDRDSQVTVRMEASHTSVAMTESSAARVPVQTEQPGMAALAAAVAAVASSQQTRAAGHHSSSFQKRQLSAIAPQIIVVRSPVKVVSGPKVSTAAQTEATAAVEAGSVVSTTPPGHANHAGTPLAVHGQQSEVTDAQTVAGRKGQMAEMIRWGCVLQMLIGDS
jgi:hypothetical protein